MTSVGAELARRDSSKFQTIVVGHARPLLHRAREEAYRIGREALFNAFHHAHARSIEVRLTFGAMDFRMRISDDGTGIDPETQAAGSRPGHWGLPGMRERADQLGASLQIGGGPGLGTEIELIVPAPQAYQPSRTSGKGWRQLRSRWRIWV